MQYHSVPHRDQRSPSGETISAPASLLAVSSPNSGLTGRIHSVETCGSVDGPGLRFVVFMQGCPLRCLYCHNPDCRDVTGGQVTTVEALIAEIQRYRSYMQASGGGITVSGGEPLLQPEFVAELMRQCQALGIHTALDTSGFSDLTSAQRVLQYTDLVLLDIKSYDPKRFIQVTQVSREPTLCLARYLHQIGKPTWIRFVLVPGLTDDVENVAALAQFVAHLTNIERVEVLPFHQMGAYKWEELGYDYLLKETQSPSPELVERVRLQFREYGVSVR
ncbi:pyruvate formate-lyase-activating protein [Acaryochloris sp. CCMEE 5410]|uniref:pyruvate formate-lyase-activating protein n=1 Tax=Acaryochloris sp. CCMEE 5410 TaxID=310037 RepID=UPI0002483C09|nr:pyruvate formate-lyase-activating protein [Acaryochloris sp. CCMEE 5410]